MFAWLRQRLAAPAPDRDWLADGRACLAAGRAGEAEQCGRNALARDAADFRAHNLLGDVFYERRALAQAEASYRRAVESGAGFATAHINLGLVLDGQGRFAEAEACYLRALALEPDNAVVHFNLGITLDTLGRQHESEAHYRHALRIRPGLSRAHFNLGTMLQKQGRLAEAQASYRSVLALDAGHADAHNNLALALRDSGRSAEALPSLRRLTELRPDSPEAFSFLLFCCSHDGALDPHALFLEHLRFAARFEEPLRPSWTAHDNAADPERPLRIGIVSADLRTHAIAFFLEPMLACLATSPGLALHAYANHDTADELTARLRALVPHWCVIAGWQDEAVARRIRDDGIDILIDLSGHTDGHRLLVFARKPAPLQLSWMAYPGTTGLSAMDYYFADQFYLPGAGFDDQFTEKIVRLPASAPFSPSAAAPPVGPLPARSNGHITFGSFNRPGKISAAVVALWSQLLRALPDAIMLLGAMSGDAARDTLSHWFRAEGVAPERLRFYDRSDMAAYLSLHHQVDICLDTFPYAGGTTTLHALWMGVPTLTLAGVTPAARTGAAILGQAGLDGFVAHDAAGFVRAGRAWAADLHALAELRAGLRTRFGRSAMLQPDVIAAGVGQALRLMWRRWCAQLPAVSFDVDIDTGAGDPLDARAHNRSGDVFYAQAALPSAEASYRRALAIDPGFTEAELNLGLCLDEQGRHDEAECCYRRVLAREPDNSLAHFNLGVALGARQRWQEAEASFRRATLVRPEFAHAHFRLGLVLQTLGQPAQAEASLRCALRISPAGPKTRAALVDLLCAQGRHGEAEQVYRQAPDGAPGDAATHYNMGVLHAGQGRLGEAKACFERALALRPGFAQAHANLGFVLRTQGSLAGAEASYRRALEADPQFTDALGGLGVVLGETGRDDEAEACFRRAQAIGPGQYAAQRNLGEFLDARGAATEAEQCYRRALDAEPGAAETHCRLGRLLARQPHRSAEAQACFRRALAADPGLADAHNELGTALRLAGQTTQAERSYLLAVQFRPGFAAAHNNLGVLYDDQGKLGQAAACFRQALDLNPDFSVAHSNLLYALSTDPDCSPERYLAEAREFGARAAARAEPYTAWPERPAGAGPQLRVGMVSGDFGEHPVGYFLESVAGQLDPGRVALYAYSNRPHEDALTARLRPRFAVWRPIAGLDDRAVARAIHADALDILIDLSGHTANNRLPVFAWRPAPVQLSWLGYFASTGVAAIDYLLTDRTSAPAHSATHFSEALRYLPDTRLCFTAPQAGPGAAPAALPALRNGYLTFGCYQNTAKINDAVLAAWGAIFRALPDARLCLQSKQLDCPDQRASMSGRLALAGIAPRRVTLSGATPRDVYLDACAAVDIMLDTFPYPGGTTTCEALWMGVPTVTLAGATMLARQGAALLGSVGLDDWIGADAGDYAARALFHAGRIDALAGLRRTLRARALASPLFDAPRFARHFEAALLAMRRASAPARD